jgi:integrase
MITAAKRGAPLPALDDVRRRLGLGLDPADPGVTAAEWMTGWLAGKQRTRRASTVRGYESHLRVHILPVIGDLPLERLNAGHVEQVLAAVPGSAATRQRVFATLRAALSAAVRQRRIPASPAVGIELEAAERAEAKTWTPAQAQQFIDATAADPLGLAFRIALLTGPRRGDLLGLRWSGADLDTGVLTVDHTILQLGGKVTEGRPKTAPGERRIYLGPATAVLLRDHRRAQLAARMQGGPGWQDHDLIFCRADGSPWPPDYVSRRFRALAEQAGLPPVKLHEARHSANSAMRAAGVDADLRMRTIGHVSRDVHAGYTHFWDDALHQAATDTETLVTGS